MLHPTLWELRKQSRELERPRVGFARKEASAHKARCTQKYRDFSPRPSQFNRGMPDQGKQKIYPSVSQLYLVG